MDPLRRRAFPVIPMIIVALGIFGFFYRFWNSPISVIKQFMWIALLIAVFYLIYKVIQKQHTNKEVTSYMKAVKQSKKLHHHKTKPTKKTTRPTALKKKHSTHLTVIEGKKGKKKNRAFF
ncbi:SA1362 family protein [Thermolongibacillus altinsuensis]|uniref:SA1362 family protein n=1 Tax=Thermolongibacillus altinsuensis TaxID=575256 RepID=UPI0025523E76|nr:SA1362 family protein [Thermolongibacillus altinsuensis]